MKKMKSQKPKANLTWIVKLMFFTGIPANCGDQSGGHAGELNSRTAGRHMHR